MSTLSAVIRSKIYVTFRKMQHFSSACENGGSPISKNKSSRVSATTPLQLISEEIQFPKLLFAFFSTRLWTKFRTVIMLRFIYLTNFETEGKYRK